MVLFNDHTLEEHTDSLAYYLPPGQAFEARFIEDTNLRKMLRALASELQRYYIILSEVCTEHDINQTQNLILEWEKALGIPGTCFDETSNIQDRRRNLLIMLDEMHGTTVEDYINLASLLGYTITIEPVKPHAMFPMAFPIYFFSSGKAVLFSMIINLPIGESNIGFPLEFPFPFISPDNSLLTCLFNRIKPANVQVFYKFLS